MGNAAFEILTLCMYGFYISPFYFLLIMLNTHLFFPLRKHILNITDCIVSTGKKKKINVTVENGQGKKKQNLKLNIHALLNIKNFSIKINFR